MNKRFVKGKGSATATIAVCAGVAILIELALCALISLAVKNRVMPEELLSIAAYIICVIGTASGTILAWIIEQENKMLSAGLTAAIAFAIPLIVAMLFWGVDGKILAISFVGCLLVYFVCVWCMGRLGDKKGVNKYKKRYR